jgi:hypothetical protein
MTKKKEELNKMGRGELAIELNYRRIQNNQNPLKSCPFSKEIIINMIRIAKMKNFKELIEIAENRLEKACECDADPEFIQELADELDKLIDEMGRK